jgi:hypothetical protein
MISGTNAFAPYVDGGGLTLGVDAGVALVGTAPTIIGGQQVSLTAQTTNYVQLNLSTGVVQVNTTGFTSGNYPIAVAVTNSTGIIALTDWRPDVPAAGPGGGGGSPGGSTGDIQYNNSGAFAGSAATVTLAGTINIPTGQAYEVNGISIGNGPFVSLAPTGSQEISGAFGLDLTDPGSEFSVAAGNLTYSFAGGFMVATNGAANITASGGIALTGSPTTVKSLNLQEGAVPSGVAGADVLYGVASSHRPAFNPNNAGALNVVGIASAGTSGHVAVLAANGIDIQDGGPPGVGTVTTTGSPANGNLTQFSGSTSVTNGNLSGDVTTAGTLAATVAKIQGTVVSGTTGSGNVVFSASPALSGVPTAPTATGGTNTTQLATTAFVQSAVGSTGVTSFNSRTGVVVPTSGDYTVAQVTGAAPLASPAFTGTATAPTAAIGTSSTQIATTAFVANALFSLVTVSFSATPTFNLSSGTSFQITLTGNVTSSTLSGGTAGQTFVVKIIQDATGGRSFVWPTNVFNGMSITDQAAGANEVSIQTFFWDGANAYATTPGMVYP